MSKMKALVCRECGKEYPTKAIHVCEMCFGPLEVKYNYEEIKKAISRKKIENGPHSMWRYIDLLPVEGTNFVGPHAGLTPLVRAKNLGAYLGIDELYIKNDTVNHPTLSFKDRVVAVALTRARELGFETVACASTGNLANSVDSPMPQPPISIATSSSRETWKPRRCWATSSINPMWSRSKATTTMSTGSAAKSPANMAGAS